MIFGYIYNIYIFKYVFVELFVVKFIFEVFVDLIVYLDIVEIKSSVKKMIDFIFGDRFINLGLKVIGF